MGYNIFGNKNSNNNGYSPIYQPKLVVNPYNTYNSTGSASPSTMRNVLPNWRSGASNLFYNCEGGASAVLETVSSLGVVSTVTSTSFSSILASSVQYPVFTYSSVDQCYYFLLWQGSTKRLCKMNDTTGVLSAIGSSFTPVTSRNWSEFSSGADISGGQLLLDPISGHLKYIHNGVYHLMNKTTGAIVSQDNPLITSGIASGIMGCNYLTEDSTLATTPVMNAGSYYTYNICPRMVGTLGTVGGVVMPASVMGYNNQPSVCGTIDSDKLVVSLYPNSVISTQIVPQVVLRSEYDRYLKSIYDYLTIP